MQLIFELLISGWLAPLLVCGGVTKLLLRSAKYSGFAASAGLAAAFLTAVMLLPWLTWLPQSHWQWLPLLSVIAAIAGPAAQTIRSPRLRQWLSFTAAVSVSALAATVLVPSWPRLANDRLYYWLGCCVAMLLVSLLAKRAVPKIPPRTSVLSLTIIALAASLLLFLGESLKFAQLGGILFASGVGWWMALTFDRRPSTRMSLENGAFAFCIVLVGLLLCGYLNSFSGIPVGCYMLIAGSPLAMLIGRAQPDGEAGSFDPVDPGHRLEDPVRFYAILVLPLLSAIVWGAFRVLSK